MDATDPSGPDEGDFSQTLFGVDYDPDDPDGETTASAVPGTVSGLRTLALVLITVATGLYLLERLEPVLRPLLIAILLCYLFLPVYSRLRRYMRPDLLVPDHRRRHHAGPPGPGQDGLPRRGPDRSPTCLATMETERGARGSRCASCRSRSCPGSSGPRPRKPHRDSEDSLTSELSQRIVRGAASAFLSVFLESIVVAFYMIFLLQSASRLPDEIRASFSTERAKGILEITQSINRAISEYLVVKVKASLLVGIPVGLACWAFGITGAVTWGTDHVLRQLPALHRGPGGDRSPRGPGVPRIQLALAAARSSPSSCCSIHGITANLIEPAMTGKALGLSPLVVLIGLAFWSLLWGFVGMVLAVPLTVIFKIVLEHTPATRPLAMMISEDE